MPGDLGTVLAEAQRRGLIGPGSVDPQIEHATALCRLLPSVPEAALDLGSGGGLPGLVAAMTWPQSHWTLLDARVRSTDFLRWAANELEIDDRVAVRCGRAEELAHLATLREHYDVVTARAVARPAVTVELAAGFLRVGGSLLISARRVGDIWDRDQCGLLGLGEPEPVSGEGATGSLIRKKTPTPDRFPRPNGVPARRPLW